MTIKSKALEINLANYKVDVSIDAKYSILQEIMASYFGLLDRLNTFLKELSHPYKNWAFIVKESRALCLDYFYLLKGHSRGYQAAHLYVDIFIDAIKYSNDSDVRTNATDNLLLFLIKIIQDSGNFFDQFTPVIDYALYSVYRFEEKFFQLFVQSYYQPKKLAQLFIAVADKNRTDFGMMNKLIKRYLLYSYKYWLDQADPIDWMSTEAGLSLNHPEMSTLLKNISHEKISYWKSEVEAIYEKNDPSIETLNDLLKFPGYGHFVETYQKTPNELLEKFVDRRQGNQIKLFFLFLTMNTPGLSMIHEESLRNINRTLTWMIAHGDHTQDKDLIQKTFSIINDQVANYPVTVLNCVLNIGEGVYHTDNSELINFFIDQLIDQGFQSPMFAGVGNDWKIKVNNAHIQNVRTWLKIISNKPQWSSRLISAMIINLSVCGVFIRDTDLFPRDITLYLNSDIEPIFNLTKQLVRLLPTFFNDIGAEGKLRDTSTRLDEIYHRKDALVHFLRKQSHVESSNRIVEFFEGSLLFWKSKEKKHLEPFVPQDILDQIDTSDIYVTGLHKIINCLFLTDVSQPKDFLSIPETQIENRLKEIPDVSEKDRERIHLAISFYKLLNSKYNFDHAEFESYISQLNVEAFPDLDKLKDAISESNLRMKTYKLLDYLDSLKTLILSKQHFEIREDIYKKRHFTVDIPSMYGTYHEIKFDAMGLALRVESLVNVLFEEIVNQFDLSLLTKATFIEIFDLLLLFDKALKLDGISSVEMERQLDILAHSLEIREFSFTQYVDLFKGFSDAVSNLINDHFYNIHEPNLSRILSLLSSDQILPKFLPETTENRERLIYRISEIFFRDRIATSLGIQQLDNFISSILSKLFNQSDNLSDEQLNHLLNYDHKRAISFLSPKRSKLYGIIDLGNKALNLIKLQSYGYPIPHGFIITTEVYRNRAIINNYPPAEENFRHQLSYKLAKLEKITGKKYGNPKNPLLLSVRSGSSISQPGMMDSFLNVGNNEEIVAGIAKKTSNPWFAWDNYRRFLQGYGMSFDLNRDDFDAIMNEYKQKFGIEFKRKFSGEQMRQVALAYKKLISDFGIDIINSPFEQLYLAIQKVLESWESPRAKAYRKIIGISDNWGTAVTVQSMAFGNISLQSGSGVCFTHSPRLPGDTIKLWGDFTIGNQGEDVVSGLVKTLPISEIQKDYEIRDTDTSLEKAFPAIYKHLNSIATELIYQKRWSPQEIEFTFESSNDKDLYLLQSRDMAIRDRKKAKSFDINDLLKTEHYLGHGIGVSGGAISGRIVFSLDDIDTWRKSEPDTLLILIRNDTVPDDIREISAADGLLTARGGVTSHASLVAHRLDKTCVVGCSDLSCDEKNKTCLFKAILLKSGDVISMDGQEGSVYLGRIKTGQSVKF